MPVSSVASAASDTQILTVNSSREVLIITNDDANKLYVLLDGGTSSATNYSFALDQGEDAVIYNYGGEVRGIWAGDGSGAARVTWY